MKTTTAISVTVFALGISTLSAQQMRMDGQGTFMSFMRNSSSNSGLNISFDN